MHMKEGYPSIATEKNISTLQYQVHVCKSGALLGFSSRNLSSLKINGSGTRRKEKIFKMVIPPAPTLNTMWRFRRSPQVNIIYPTQFGQHPLLSIKIVFTCNMKGSKKKYRPLSLILILTKPTTLKYYVWQPSSTTQSNQTKKKR